MALWDRSAQSCCLVRASAPLPQAHHPSANPTGAASARPLSLLPCRSPCRATPAAPGRPLLPPSPHQLLAAARSPPHPPLSLTPSALRAEPRPFPALRGLQAAALPSLCTSSWPESQPPAFKTPQVSLPLCLTWATPGGNLEFSPLVSTPVLPVQQGRRPV